MEIPPLRAITATSTADGDNMKLRWASALTLSHIAERANMKLRWAVTYVVAAAAVLASGCTSTNAASPSGSTASGTIPLLRVGLPVSEPTLDETKDINANWVDSLGLENLVKFGPQGQVEPSLATSMTQASPVSYVYHVRHGVKFWDGQPLTAADVAYSLNYDRAPGSKVAFSFASVKTITATTPDTVTVTLVHPDASWQFVPAQENAYIFEMKFAEAHKGSFGNPGVLIMGTGPWEVSSLDPTTDAKLSANPHWWGGKVPIQHISIQFFSSETSEALAFRAGEIDLAPSIASPKSFAASSGATLLSTPSCSNAFFGMNTLTAGWNDVHVRRAVAYVLNRSDIIAANGGYATPISTVTPPQLLRTIASQSQVDALLKSLPLYPYSITKAKQEMAQSAYPHGFSTTVLAYNYGNAVNVFQVVAAELARIGIHMQIKQMEVTAWQAVETGPVSQRSTAFATGGCFNPDPSAYTDFLGSKNTQGGQWNISGYRPAEVDNLITEGASTSDPAKRFAAYSKLFQKLQTDVPYVGLFVSDTTIALSSKFTYSGFNQWMWDSPYALNIKSAG
jgi:peptide/nickel transport system substrate-binding protein